MSTKDLKGFPNLVYAVSVKSDGNMDFRYGDATEVRKNRSAFLKRAGVLPKNSVVMEVEHAEKILAVVSSQKTGIVAPEDVLFGEAFITAEKDITLLLMTADCLPISFYDPVRNVIALAHLGWRPTERMLIFKVIAKLVSDFKSQPQDILVSIGPGIHKESYVFKDPIQKTMPEWLPFLEDTPAGETKVDLVGFNKAELIRAGVSEENISIDAADSATSENLFSHYRSVRTGEPEGRFVTILALR